MRGKRIGAGGIVGRRGIGDLEVGSRWARVRVVRFSEGMREVDEYESVKESKIVFRCDCGKEWEVWAGDWKGRKRVRDCGCGVSAMDGQIVVRSVSVPLELWMELERWRGKGPKISVSKAVCDFVREGLEREKGKEVNPWGN